MNFGPQDLNTPTPRIAAARESGVLRRRRASTRSLRARAYLPAEAARARAEAAGVTVNGLAILNKDAGLADYERRPVIAGPGGFVMAVEGLETFQDCLVRKLVREIEPASPAAVSGG